MTLKISYKERGVRLGVSLRLIVISEHYNIVNYRYTFLSLGLSVGRCYLVHRPSGSGGMHHIPLGLSTATYLTTNSRRGRVKVYIYIGLEVLYNGGGVGRSRVNREREM